MKILIIDNSNIKKVKLLINKNIKIGFIYKCVIKKYFIKNLNLKYNNIINTLVIQQKKHTINSYKKLKFNYNNNCGIILNNNLNPLGNKILGLIDFNVYYKNLKLLYISINEKI